MNIIKKIVKFLTLEILLTAICVGIVFLTHSFGCAKNDSEDVGIFVNAQLKEIFEKARPGVYSQGRSYTITEFFKIDDIEDGMLVRRFLIAYDNSPTKYNLIKVYFSQNCKDNTLNKICKKHLIKVDK